MSKNNKGSVEESEDEDTALCAKSEPEEQSSSSSEGEDFDYTTYHDKSETEDELASADDGDEEEERKRHEESKARILERRATPPRVVEEGVQGTEGEQKKPEKSDKRREHSKHRSHKSDSALVGADSRGKSDKKKDKKKKTHHRHRSEPGKRGEQEEQDPQTAKKVVRRGTPALVPPEVLEEMSREEAECSDQELQEATKKNTALNAQRRNSVGNSDDDEEEEDDESEEEEEEEKTDSQGYFLADDDEDEDEDDESEDGTGRKKSELVLPPGWEVRVDKRTGNKFYVDHNTRSTQWDPPKEAYFRLPLDFGFPDPKIAAQLYLKHGKSSSGRKSILKPTSPAPKRDTSTAGDDSHNDDNTAVPITQDFVKDLMLALHCAVTMSVALFIPDGSTTATAASTLPIPMPYEESYYEPRNVPRQHNPHRRESCCDAAAEPVDLAPLSKEEEELRLFYTTHSHRVSRPGSRVSMIVKDYAPDTFEVIRQLYGIGHQAYLQHWAVPRFPRYTHRRRSKIIMCDDESMVLKTLSHNEAKVLFAVLPDYARYIVDNPQTTLTKVFGLHRLHKGHDDTYFAVMANATTPLYNMVQYDLKGAASGRKPARRGHHLKDADLTRNLVLAEDTRARLVDQLACDVRFLCDHSLMNYSLLLGVYHAADRVVLSSTTKCNPDSAPQDAAASSPSNPVAPRMRRWNSLGFVEETYGPQFQNVPKHLTENARHSLEMPQVSPQLPQAPATPVHPHEIDFFDDDDDDSDDDDVEDELFDDDGDEEGKEDEEEKKEQPDGKEKKEGGEGTGDEQTAVRAPLDMWMNLRSASDQQELYCVGVIDFFTVYSTSTKLSGLFRSVSTPSAYAARFMEMVRTRFQGVEEEPQIAQPTPKKGT